MNKYYCLSLRTSSILIIKKLCFSICVYSLILSRKYKEILVYYSQICLRLTRFVEYVFEMFDLIIQRERCKNMKIYLSPNKLYFDNRKYMFSISIDCMYCLQTVTTGSTCLLFADMFALDTFCWKRLFEMFDLIIQSEMQTYEHISVSKQTVF